MLSAMAKAREANTASVMMVMSRSNGLRNSLYEYMARISSAFSPARSLVAPLTMKRGHSPRPGNIMVYILSSSRVDPAMTGTRWYLPCSIRLMGQSGST